MYGVPADLPILAFVGHEANQICLGRFQVQVHFSGVGSIQMEGRWELRDATGALVDAREEHKDKDSYRIHRIMDVPVVGVRVDPPRSFTLQFGNDLSLTVFDDSEQYESFAIHLDGRASIYV